MNLRRASLILFNYNPHCFMLSVQKNTLNRFICAKHRKQYVYYILMPIHFCYAFKKLSTAGINC